MAESVSSTTVLKRIDVSDITTSIMEQIEESIINGALKEGDKLPSEQELSKQAGVGRRSVRDALKGLEMKGLISIRKGAGAFVTRNDFDSYIETLMRNVHAYLNLDRAKLKHLLQYRELLNGSVIVTLAANPDPEVIEKLERSLAAQEEAYRSNSGAKYTSAHLEFHQTIIDSLKNPIATVMHTQVIKLLEPYMRRAGGIPEIMGSAIQEHRVILDAIKSADASQAQAAFSSHMAVSLEHLERVV